MGIIQEHEIIKTKLEIQEQALKNIIQEIHDNIGQILSLAKLHLGTLDFSKPEDVAQKTFKSNELIGKAIKDLRYLSKYLDAAYISRIGLLKAVNHELSFVPTDRAANPLLLVEGSLCGLHENEELLLFRIIQEIIQYLLNASQTSLVGIRFHCSGSELLIQVTEQTKEPEELSPVPTAWMDELNDRSWLIGASATVDKEPRKQTLTIRFPYTNSK